MPICSLIMNTEMDTEKLTVTLAISACIAFGVTLIPSIVCHKWFTRIVEQERAGDIEGAHRSATQLLNRLKSSPKRLLDRDAHILRVLTRLSELAERRGDFEEAFGWAEQATGEHFPSSARMIAMARVGNIRRRQDRVGEAAEWEARALGLANGPALISAHGVGIEGVTSEATRVKILHDQGRFGEALNQIALLCQGADERHRVMFFDRKAAVLRGMGRYEEATATLVEWERLIEAMPSRSSTSHSVNGAFNVLLRATHRGLLQTSRLSRVQILLEAGQSGAAGEAWNAFAAGSMSDTTRAIHDATGAWLFASHGRADEARRFIDGLEEMGSAGCGGEQRATINTLVGRALFTLRDYDDACRRFQHVIDHCAGNPLTQAQNRALLAACYTKQECPNRARAEWEAVVATGFIEAAFTREARAGLLCLQAVDHPDYSGEQVCGRSQ